jgi:hypothetical protein
MRGFLPRIEAAEVEYASTEEKTNDINRWDDGVFGPERR